MRRGSQQVRSRGRLWSCGTSSGKSFESVGLYTFPAVLAPVLRIPGWNSARRCAAPRGWRGQNTCGPYFLSTDALGFLLDASSSEPSKRAVFYYRIHGALANTCISTSLSTARRLPRKLMTRRDKFFSTDQRYYKFHTFPIPAL
jgi:hypothetical protein